jgi:hypothetical protein
MKVGDMVMLVSHSSTGPLGVVVESTSMESDFHARVRVMWSGEDLPIQAKSASISGNRVTTWMHPRNFKVVSIS